MGKIQAITMQNLKGTTDKQVLTGKDIFVGPNGSGKTTRLQALHMALLGYVPGNGKRPVDNYKFSSDESVMGIGLEVDGFKFTRTFERTIKMSKGVPNPTISETVSVSPARGERTETERKTRVATEVGNFPVMLDFNEFLSLSDAKRRDFIYGLSAGINGGWDKERVAQYLEERLLTVEIEVKSPDLYQALQETMSILLAEYQDGMTIDEGLLAMRGYVTREWATWKEKAKNAEGAIKQLAEQKNKMAETDRNIEANKTELTEMREQLVQTEAQLARDTEKKKAIDRRLARLQELGSLIDQLAAQTPDPTEWIDQQIESIEVQIVQTEESDEYAVLTSKKAELQKQLAQIQQYDIPQFNRDITRLTTERVAIQQTVNTIQQTNGVCVIQKQIACNKDFSSYLQHAAGQLAEKDDQLVAQQEYLRIASEQANKWQTQITALEQRMSVVMQQTTRRQQENAQAAKSIRNLQAQKSAILNTEQKRLDDLKWAQDEREKLQNESIEPIAPLDLLETRRNGLRDQIIQLQEKVEEQEKVRNQMASLRSSMLANKEAEYKSEAFKMLDQALGAKGIQGEIVKTMLDPMREDIQTNLRVLGMDKPVFFQTESDTGQEIFQFGWEEYGQRRNFDALSTGQQMIFLIAFLVTVLDRAKPPVKVLALDNFENLDQTNLRNVLQGLDKLSDKLDNILISGVIDAYNVLPVGWTVHQVGIKEAAEDVA